MSLTSLVAFNIAILGALIVPGPAFLSLLRQSLARGRGAALGTAAGLATGATLWSLAALTGLHALFTLVPWAYGAIKIGGAIYLTWLAVRLWRGARAPLPAPDTAAGGRGGRGQGFRLGLFVNLSNPKAVFFIASIFAAVFPQMPKGEEAALLLANHLTLELIWYSCAALMLTTAPIRGVYLRTRAWIDRLSAAILALVAFRTVA